MNIYIHFHKVDWRASKFERYLASATMVLSKSDLVHVSIGDIYNTLVVKHNETVLFPSKLIMMAPTIQHSVVVPLPKPVSIEDYGSGCRGYDKRYWVSWLNSLCGGWLQRFNYDCVSVSKQVLKGGGIEIPRTVTTPQALFDYLIDNELGEDK